jgi:iron-sulfur cluster repair protein YtfE (RIC family)
LTVHLPFAQEVLFPALASSPNAGGPLSVMRSEHLHIDRQVVDLARAATLEQAKDALDQLLLALRDHFHKEDQLVFPMCESYLGDEKLNQLGEVWAKRRGVG